MFPGMKNGYVLYRVDTHDPDGGQGRSVRRRFRDFVVRPGKMHPSGTMLRGVVWHACSSGLTLTNACIDTTAEPGRHAEGVTPGLLPAVTPREAAQPSRGAGAVWCGAVYNWGMSSRGQMTPSKQSQQHIFLCCNFYQVPDSEFVASRCAALEVWLRRMSTHPVIGHSQVLAWSVKCASLADVAQFN